MHTVASCMAAGLFGLAAASPLSTRQVIPNEPEQSESKGFTLVAHVTDPATDFDPSVDSFTVSSIHTGAGLALAGLYSDSARTWYLNGTDEQVESKTATVISDGGTPTFPNGLTVVKDKEDSSGLYSVRIDAGPGTPGVGLTTFPDIFTYLTAPFPGSYVVCNESVPYYQDQKFLLLKYAKTEDYGEVETSIPDGCAGIRLLPQCAELEKLSEDAISSHEYARTVGCYKDVAAIDFSQYPS